MTIRKNTKRAAEVLTAATACKVYTLNNYFIGEECEPRYAAEALHRFSYAKLTTHPGGSHVVHVHSNLWYELT